MSLFVNGFELFYGVVRIDLGGGETAVAQNGLDGVQVRAVVQQMGRERVPDHVWAAFVYCGHHIQIFTNNSIDRLRVKLFTVCGDKDIIIFRSLAKFFLQVFQIHCQ